MQKYIQLITEFHNSNPSSLEFVKNHLPKHFKHHSEDQTEIEEILDYLFSNPSIKISVIGYETIREKTIKWHKKLQTTATKDTEVEGIDYEVALKLDDGFQFVKLVSKESFEREGKLMSHCVASYFGRDTTIYSLRDSKNLPHCTIEDGSQVKGKGNGAIDPKYVDYVVKFLGHLGMSVGENEMKNLGYYKLDSIEKDLTCDRLYNGYVCEKNIDKIKDKGGNQYKGMGLWNIKPVCEIEDDGKFRLYEDIKGVVAYENLTCVKKDKDSTRNASSGDFTRNASSGNSTQNASSGDFTRNASSGDFTRNASSGDFTRNASSGDSTRNASSGNFTRNASSGDFTRSEVNGKYGITADIGIESKSKGIIGTWIVLAEYRKNSEGYMQPIAVKCGQIDGTILKENTWYTLKNGEFMETE